MLWLLVVRPWLEQGQHCFSHWLKRAPASQVDLYLQGETLPGTSLRPSWQTWHAPRTAEEKGSPFLGQQLERTFFLVMDKGLLTVGMRAFLLHPLTRKLPSSHLAEQVFLQDIALSGIPGKASFWPWVDGSSSATCLADGPIAWPMQDIPQGQKPVASLVFGLGLALARSGVGESSCFHGLVCMASYMNLVGHCVIQDDGLSESPACSSIDLLILFCSSTSSSSLPLIAFAISISSLKINKFLLKTMGIYTVNLYSCLCKDKKGLLK